MVGQRGNIATALRNVVDLSPAEVDSSLHIHPVMARVAVSRLSRPRLVWFQ